MKTTKILQNRDERLNIRASHYQKAVISEAAKIRNTTVSQFIIMLAFEAAQEILAHETNFKLPKKQWDAFCEALDRAPCYKPELNKLLTESDVFDNE